MPVSRSLREVSIELASPILISGLPYSACQDVMPVERDQFHKESVVSQRQKSDEWKE